MVMRPLQTMEHKSRHRPQGLAAGDKAERVRAAATETSVTSKGYILSISQERGRKTIIRGGALCGRQELLLAWLVALAHANALNVKP